VFKPYTRQNHRSGIQKSLQQHHIFGCLAKWRETEGFIKLVDGVLVGYIQDDMSYGGYNFEKTKMWVLTSNNVFVRL